MTATGAAADAVLAAYPAFADCWAKSGNTSQCADQLEAFTDARAALASQIESWRAFGA